MVELGQELRSWKLFCSLVFLGCGLAKATPVTYSESGYVAAFAGLGLPHDTAFQGMLAHPIQKGVEGRHRREPVMGTVPHMGCLQFLLGVSAHSFPTNAC